uniref:Uncharacterized protein n=1 Tax=Glossina palpalis gambiensis TaxID=67801 RepID=A0A1B0BAQ6_9MUSC
MKFAVILVALLGIVAASMPTKHQRVASSMYQSQYQIPGVYQSQNPYIQPNVGQSSYQQQNSYSQQNTVYNQQNSAYNVMNKQRTQNTVYGAQRNQNSRHADKDFLAKQKFLFEIVYRVEDPLMFEEWIQLAQTATFNPSEYIHRISCAYLIGNNLAIDNTSKMKIAYIFLAVLAAVSAFNPKHQKVTLNAYQHRFPIPSVFQQQHTLGQQQTAHNQKTRINQQAIPGYQSTAYNAQNAGYNQQNSAYNPLNKQNIVYGSQKNQNVKYASKEFLAKQKFLFEIVYRVEDPLMFEEWIQLAQTATFNPSEYIQYDYYMQKFQQAQKAGALLPQGEFFGALVKTHNKQLIGLFNFFYFAKNFETFQNNVAWARVHVNEHMFIYALNLAVIHRQDLQGMILPSIYEIFPQYFFNNRFMLRDNIQQYNQDPKYVEAMQDVQMFWMPVDYTRDIDIFNQESVLSYFTEDLDWNAYWYYYNLDYAFFLDGKTFGLNKDRRGENYLYTVRQILARYYQERLSHGLGDIPQVSVNAEYEAGYDPQLIYHNGVGYSYRKNYYEIQSYTNAELLNKIANFFTRLDEVISTGYYKTQDGTFIDLRKPQAIEFIGNVMQGNVDSDKPQPVVIRTFLGPKYDEFGRTISIMDNQQNFIELDQFIHTLTAGVNTVQRNSQDFYLTIDDRTTYTELYKQVMLALEDKQQFPMDISQPHCGFPDRLVLPRGWAKGMPMQLFVFVSPFTASYQPYSTYDTTYSCGIGSGVRYVDQKPFGYPFDRIVDELEFFVPNMYLKDVKIYHADVLRKYADQPYLQFGQFDYNYYNNNY